MGADALQFEIVARSASSAGRVGRVTTPHGSFDTPAFMPVGTKGTIKGVPPWLVAQSGAQVLLNNTYHMMLRPGAEVVARQGGAHAFMGWDRPILTDSGGFQAFSMSDVNSLDEDGVTFRSIVDGSRIRLTPERAMEVQNLLGADIIMALDDCPPAAGGGDAVAAGAVSRPPPADRARIEAAVGRTTRWLERCARAHARSDQALFGIVQGGIYDDLRERSVREVCAVDLPGYAIGGVAVGESPAEIARVVALTGPMLPEDRPRYLMGVGYERDLLIASLCGVDMFDCVLPTRNARNANAFTRSGRVRLRNAAHAADAGPIEAGCDCPACRPGSVGWETPDGRPFSRAYLRHLFMAEEMLGPILVTLHNLRHFQRFMVDIRATLADDDWPAFAARWPVVGGVVADCARLGLVRGAGKARG